MDHRRQAAGAFAVRHDSPHPYRQPARHGDRVCRQCRRRPRQARTALLCWRRRTLWRALGSDRLCGQGRNTQSSDCHRAISGRGDRLGRRNSRRRSDRTWRQTQGGIDRIHGVAFAHSRTRPALGTPGSATFVGPRRFIFPPGSRGCRLRRSFGRLLDWHPAAHRDAAADHAPGAHRRRIVQQRVRTSESARLLPHFRAASWRRSARLSQADHDRGWGGQYRRPARAQTRVTPRRADRSAWRTGYVDRDGRGRSVIDVDRVQSGRSRFRFGAARQRRDAAPGAGGHRSLLANGRRQSDSVDS